MRLYLLLSMMILRVNTLIFSSSKRFTIRYLSVVPKITKFDQNTEIACQRNVDDLSSDSYLFGPSIVSFKDLGLSSDLSDSLELLEQTKATSIQAKAIPLILQGKDVVISSETGSGKTFAYLLPLIQKCIETINVDVDVESQVPSASTNEIESKFTYPKVVVLVPNKDLAAQVVKMGSRVLANLTESKLPVTIGALTRNVGNDRWPLRKDCPTILVCTPVIISNFVRGPIVKDEMLFDTIQHLVLDEADMLVEGSYQVEVEKIMEALKKSRRAKIRDGLIDMKTKTCQYILAAATLPNSGKYSVESYTKKMFPYAQVVSNEHVHKLHPQIEQQFIKVYGDAQDGAGTSAIFKYPLGISIDTKGDIYLSDNNTNKIKKIDSTGWVYSVAGKTNSSGGFSDGIGENAQFKWPNGVAVDSLGNLFIADYGNNHVRVVDPSGVINSFAGGGGYTTSTLLPASYAYLGNVRGVCIDNLNNVYI